MTEQKIANEIFIEAESFSDKGGWIVDQQSMETIHSSYIMAHGMGVPVENAITRFEVAESGEYRAFCLTRDWTAVWGVKDPIGKFKLIIDASALPETLGTNGDGWSWQYAGSIKLDAGMHEIELCDLTGFNGRCDAIYLTDDEEFIPSDDISDIDEMRKRLNYKEIADAENSYDLIVVGGGIAGVCTALSASCLGVNTLLINDRGVLGGCNSSEIRVCLGGQIKNPPYDKLGDVVKTISPIFGSPGKYDAKYFEDERKLLAFEELGGKVILNERVTDIEMDGDRIVAVICTNTLTGKKMRIRATLFADCSGDATVARLGGAEVMYGKESRDEFDELLGQREHKNVVMGHSIRWFARRFDEPSDFPRLDLGLSFNEDNFLDCVCGDWEQETGFRRDMVREIEYIRDYGLRAIFANWSYEKNDYPDKGKFANYKMCWISPLGGKRESYRVVGDYILTENDLDAKTEYDDGTAGITWGVDIHFPDTVNEREFGEAFRSFAYHRGMPKICNVPYRCLYSKDIGNLFLGGRIVSTTHVAFSAIRVMRTLGMLGEVVGMAASLCKENGCMPRDIYTSHLDALKAKMEEGVYLPDAFACGDINDIEKYHFKDLDWWILSDGRTTRPITEKGKAKFKRCIEEWNIPHKHKIPDEWK